jgi:hypothetical protein
MKCKHLALSRQALYLPENTWLPRLFAAVSVDWILAAKYYCLAIMLFACLLLAAFLPNSLYSIQANFAQQLFAACLAGGFEVFMNI